MYLSLLLPVTVAGLLIVLGSVAFTYHDAPRHGLDPDTWSGIVALTGAVAFLAYVVSLPVTGWWFLLPVVGSGFLVYLLVRSAAGDAPEPDAEFTPSGSEES